MLGSDRAIERYREAKRLYETKADPGRNWAFESFVESKGYTMPENGVISFNTRIQFKIELVEDITSS